MMPSVKVLNLLTKDLCDEERPAHEGQSVEKDNPAGNDFMFSKLC